MRHGKLISALLIFLMGTVSLTPAQAQGDKAVPMKGADIKGRAPVNREILRVTLPRPTQHRLSNGLRVLILENHKLPTVAFSLMIKTGALSDPPDLPGLAGFVAEMLREGTVRRTSEQLAEEVDRIGASLGASAGFGASTSRVTASGLVENTDQLLDLMTDIVRNATFPAEELDKFKLREMADLERQRANPNFLARERFYSVLYGDFPAARISSTPESVEKVTPENLKDFHSAYYRPNNAILGVVGDVTPESVMPLVEKYFGVWERARIPSGKLPRLAKLGESTIHLVDRPDSVQTNLIAGNHSLTRKDPDFIPLNVMNRILGGGPASRLFLNLREDKGYTYGAYSSFRSGVYPGPWSAATQVRTEVSEPSLREMFGEFKRIREEPVPEKELDDARRAMVASFALSLEQPGTVLRNWLTVEYYGLSEDYWDRYPEKVAGVNAKVVQKMATKYVDLDHMQIVAVGDESKIKGGLEKFGNVVTYDTEGRRKDGQ